MKIGWHADTNASRRIITWIFTYDSRLFSVQMNCLWSSSYRLYKKLIWKRRQNQAT